ncbi:hypothetical protein BDW59DRAFT_94908 [Aspergillus cavernicola]|uniref:C3H1-type domain-containing protein n=1 Tax=Aspergillus cavernicola TaxID=176166 RepID=A0ABR4IYZ5_9EURO
MPKKGGTTTHHCPKKSKGNCRYNKSKGYCTAHQTGNRNAETESVETVSSSKASVRERGHRQPIDPLRRSTTAHLCKTPIPVYILGLSRRPKSFRDSKRD